MDESLLEIRNYDGEGYQPLIDYGAWRVAILRWEQSMQPDKIDFMERHTQTDEVFVLLNGQATLILGGNSNRVDSIQPQKMEARKLYNVKKNVWHTVVMSKVATILIVEESNTGVDNSEYYNLTPESRKQIRDLTKTNIPR